MSCHSYVTRVGLCLALLSSVLGRSSMAIESESSPLAAAEESSLAIDPSVTAVSAVSDYFATHAPASSFPEGDWDWRDTLSVFLGYEGSKQPQDFGVNAHFGGRTHINWGAPLWEEAGLGLQLGTAINATANAVQVNERIEGNSSRTQSFTTVGLFQRDPSGWRWALAYDFLFQDYYDDFDLGQWRGRLGYELSPANEVGVQAAVSDNGDAGQFGPVDVYLRPITHGSVYWRHTWNNGAALRGWIGVAEGHSEANVALGDLPPQDECLVYGSDVFVPLGDYLAIFGESNFMTPADTGAVDAYLGFEIFPWGGAKRSRRNPFTPVLPVANNTSMTVDLERQ